MKHIAIIGYTQIIMSGLTRIIDQMTSDTQVKRYEDLFQLKKERVRPDITLFQLPKRHEDFKIDQIKSLAKQSQALVVYGEGNDMHRVWSYYQAGAMAYFCISDSTSVIKLCLAAALKKKPFIDPDIIYRWIQDPPVPDASGSHTTIKRHNIIEVLSPRQREVAKLLLMGSRVSDIAHLLSLKVSTVSTTKKVILRKMKVDNLMSLKELMEMAN
jgi:DNA-binding NarL/FixJ family response regulator